MRGIDKQLMTLGDEPVLCHSLNLLEKSNSVCGFVVVAHPDRIDAITDLIASKGYAKVIGIVPGGERRQDSTRSGLDALSEAGIESEFVAVHDGARPFIDEGLLKRGLEVATKIGAAVPAMPMRDTVKQVENGIVAATLPREGLFTVQTPQIFRREVLESAYAVVSEAVTDDASMVEKAGGLVAVFPGDQDNIKLTTPSDIAIAETIALNIADDMDRPRSTGEYRYGIGFDSHRFTTGSALRLGGVDIPFNKRLAGHSDGDVLIHAVASAVLGASGKGDLGSNFPSDDSRYADIDSAYFVTTASQMASVAGWAVDFIDATVIAQAPRLSTWLSEFEERIALMLKVDISRVNVKATSTDELGAIGEGLGIAAQAIATLVRSRGN